MLPLRRCTWGLRPRAVLPSPARLFLQQPTPPMMSCTALRAARWSHEGRSRASPCAASFDDGGEAESKEGDEEIAEAASEAETALASTSSASTSFPADATLPVVSAGAASARITTRTGVLIERELPGWARFGRIVLTFYAAATALPPLIDCISGERELMA